MRVSRVTLKSHPSKPKQIHFRDVIDVPSKCQKRKDGLRMEPIHSSGVSPERGHLHFILGSPSPGANSHGGRLPCVLQLLFWFSFKLQLGVPDWLGNSGIKSLWLMKEMRKWYWQIKRASNSIFLHSRMAWEGCQETSTCSLRVSCHLSAWYLQPVSGLCIPSVAMTGCVGCSRGQGAGGELGVTSCRSHQSLSISNGLLLKPGLLIKLTSLNTVRIRIANLYTFKQTNWIIFLFEGLEI